MATAFWDTFGCHVVRQTEITVEYYSSVWENPFAKGDHVYC